MRISDWSSDVCSSDLAARRAAGDALAVPRIAGVAIMVVVAGGAEGEFGHVEPAEVERAGGIEPGQRRRGPGRLPVTADRRAAARYLAGAVIHVILCQRHSGPRAERGASAAGSRGNTAVGKG